MTAAQPYQQLSAQAQQELASEPYDGWFTPDGECKAEFHRTPEGYLVRFPEEADFEISDDGASVVAWPEFDVSDDHIAKLFNNNITPILGNHLGGLFLHGSAVTVDDRAIAFVGLSRDGKTTLAGSFAKAGYPFLTEDVIDLDLKDDGYWLQPKPSALRLFQDSAEHLLGHDPRFLDPDEKFDVVADDHLPFASVPKRLERVFVLGTDHSAALALSHLAPQNAVAALLPQSFILDVEDKARLKGHFGRLADLSSAVRCVTLDYPRQYHELPRVRQAILNELEV